MPTINLTISQDLYDDLARAFSKDRPLTAEDFASLASLALEQWTDTLLGITRFHSMSELYAAWLRRLFPRLLPDADLDEKALVSRFNLPYGQAAYIARVLREEDTLAARRKWLDKLEAEFTKRLDEARQWVKDGRGEETMEFYLHKYARRELGIILGRMLETGYPTRAIKTTATMGDYSVVQICAGDVERIVQQIAAEKNHLNP